MQFRPAHAESPALVAYSRARLSSVAAHHSQAIASFKLRT